MNLRVGNRIASPLRQQGSATQPQIGIATGMPGEYTVADLANFYDINPLYKAHIDGRGQTVGIATLANFLPSDAYDWRRGQFHLAAPGLPKSYSGHPAH
jgi:hypothetical protein